MKRFQPMALCGASMMALAVYLIPASMAAAGGGKLNFLGYQEPLCSSHASLCADPAENPNGEYVGHDEPSIEFKSGVRGSGNDITYMMTLPSDPKAFPNASGAGGTTWNFELRPTFWFGLTLCDTESSPEFTKTCTPDSDANDLVGTNPQSRGLHRQASRQRLHGVAVLRAGLRPAVRGIRLHRHPVLRGNDHRQPDARSEHRSREQRRLRELRPGRPRADQLGLHHQERTIAGTRQPAVHRNLQQPELQRGQPGYRPRT